MRYAGDMPVCARTRDEILEILQANGETLRRLGVRRLGLFGSSAAGEATALSDIDLVVELGTKTFDAYMDVKAFLEGLFQCPVDLVLSDAVKPRLRAVIVDSALYAPRSEERRVGKECRL